MCERRIRGLWLGHPSDVEMEDGWTLARDAGAIARLQILALQRRFSILSAVGTLEMMCRVPRNWGSRLMPSSIPFGQCVCSFLSVLNAIVRFQRRSMTDFQVLESENMFSTSKCEVCTLQEFLSQQHDLQVKTWLWQLYYLLHTPKSFVGRLLLFCIFQISPRYLSIHCDQILVSRSLAIWLV